jgi:undecaprenyl-diphosphatase
MTSPHVPPSLTVPERRTTTRGRFRWFWDIIFGGLRLVGRHAHGFYQTVGIFLLASTIIAVGATYGFTRIAVYVQGGHTQGFDDAVLQYIAERHSPLVERLMFEITFLGTGLVVMVMVLVSGLFLWLTKHRNSAVLLVVATAGSILLNNLLKMSFDRPRPQVFTWGQHVVSSSFPSGHAMSATVVYITIAYLAARLQRTHAGRALTILTALVLILAICVSRLYLGVHYPSDVLAGVLVGLAWAGFCMATLEATQLLARRLSPQAVEETPQSPPPHDAVA